MTPLHSTLKSNDSRESAFAEVTPQQIKPTWGSTPVMRKAARSRRESPADLRLPHLWGSRSFARQFVQWLPLHPGLQARGSIRVSRPEAGSVTKLLHQAGFRDCR